MSLQEPVFIDSVKNGDAVRSFVPGALAWYVLAKNLSVFCACPKTLRKMKLNNNRY